MADIKLDFQAFLRDQADRELAAEDDAFGEQFYAELAAEADVEKSGWAVNLAERVATRLQAKDPVEARKVPVVFWSEARNAYALPGRRIYLSRRLLEEALPEDAVAFLFAHELAHHRLGHLQALLPALRPLRHLPAARLVSFALGAASRLLLSRDNEADADAWALERCRSVGYDGRACLALFDLLRRIAEDHGDLDMAHGPGDVEELAARELERDAQPEWKNALRELADRVGTARWEVTRGYPAHRERRARLEALLGREP